MSDGKSIIDGKFEIVSPLGAGGMGSVYLSRQIGMERMVALKILRNDSGYSLDGEARARFEREVQTLSTLRHRSIVTVYGAGVSNGLPYMAMEYVEGKSLSSLLSANKPLPLNMVTHIAIQICEALHCAHAHGVIHRDLKPNNIIVADNGEVKLIDFGLAKLMPGAAVKDQQLTEAGSAVGSVLYMSPEQCLGQAVDARSDIYGFGCVLYHCLTGVPPFVGDHSVAVMHQHVQSQLPRLAEVIPNVVLSDGWQDLLDVATAKESKDRYQTAAELLADVQRLNDNLPIRAVSVPKLSASDHPRTAGALWKSKRVMLGAAASVAAIAGLAAFLLSSQPSSVAGGNSFAQLEQKIEKLKLEKERKADEVAEARLDFALAELYAAQVRCEDIAPAVVSNRKAMAEMSCIPPLHSLPIDEAFASAKKMLTWDISSPAKAKIADLMLTRVTGQKRTVEGDIDSKYLDEMYDLCATAKPRTADLKRMLRMVCVHKATCYEQRRLFADAKRCYDEIEKLSDEPAYKVYCLARKDAISAELGRFTDTTAEQLRLFATIEKIDPPVYVMALNALLWNLDLHSKDAEYKKLLQQSCGRYQALDIEEPFCLYEAKGKLALNAGDWQGALTSWECYCADLRKRKQYHGNATSVIFQQSYLLKALGQPQKSSEKELEAKAILEQDTPGNQAIHDSIQNNSLVQVTRALACNGKQQNALTLLNERIAELESRSPAAIGDADKLRFYVAQRQIEKSPDFVIKVMQPFVARCKKDGEVTADYLMAMDILACAQAEKQNYKEAFELEQQVVPLLKTASLPGELKAHMVTRLSVYERKLKRLPTVRTKANTSI
jgi:serine/threonine protein kinase